MPENQFPAMMRVISECRLENVGGSVFEKEFESIRSMVSDERLPMQLGRLPERKLKGASNKIIISDEHRAVGNVELNMLFPKFSCNMLPETTRLSIGPVRKLLAKNIFSRSMDLKDSGMDPVNMLLEMYRSCRFGNSARNEGSEPVKLLVSITGRKRKIEGAVSR